VWKPTRLAALEAELRNMRGRFQKIYRRIEPITAPVRVAIAVMEMIDRDSKAHGAFIIVSDSPSKGGGESGYRTDVGECSGKEKEMRDDRSPWALYPTRHNLAARNLETVL
jgi:hypothetical protein